MASSSIMQRVQAQVETLRRAAKSQRDIGNIEEAKDLESSAAAAENMVFDIAAMLLQDPNTSEAAILKYLESYYK